MAIFKKTYTPLGIKIRYKNEYWFRIKDKNPTKLLEVRRFMTFSCEISLDNLSEMFA